MSIVKQPLLALMAAALLAPVAWAQDIPHGYANDSYATQAAYDVFNQSVKGRLAATRVGSSTRYFGSAPTLIRSDDAMAAPAYSRQLDCVYYSGFTVWADMYSTWASQDSRNGFDGYKFRTLGPALGFDWSNGPITVGVASTYSWGKIKSRDFDHDRKTQTWAIEGYGQLDNERYYINATLGYGYNRFRSERGTPAGYATDRYHTNAWNFDAEFGLKFGTDAFKIVPNVGFRYYHDRRNNIGEAGPNGLDLGRKNYYSTEIPVGIDLSYEAVSGRSVIVPHFRAAWIPEIARRRGNASGVYRYNGGGTFSDSAANRGRHAFQIGGGIEAKITEAISAHVDYNAILRRHAYEQRVSVGLGFTF